MNKIRIIDLLNKIANGEEVPKVIKFLNYKYIFDTFDKEYQRYQNGVCYGFGEDRRLDIILDDEVEIIEEEKKAPTLNDIRESYNLSRIEEKKIPEKLDWNKNDFTYPEGNLMSEETADMLMEIQDKVNFILDYLKSKGK